MKEDQLLISWKIWRQISGRKKRKKKKKQREKRDRGRNWLETEVYKTNWIWKGSGPRFFHRDLELRGEPVGKKKKEEGEGIGYREGKGRIE